MPTSSHQARGIDPEDLFAIAESTAGVVGNDFLVALVKSLRRAMDVSIAAITEGLGDPVRRARATLSYNRGEVGKTFEYELESMPCEIVYANQRLTVPRKLCEEFPFLLNQFPDEKNLKSYCGVPLHDSKGVVCGNFWTLSEEPIEDRETTETIMRIYSMRVEAELHRLAYDKEREGLIRQLARTNERLSKQYSFAKQGNRLKSELIGMVAHDMRNPLAAIMSRTEFLETLISRACQGETIGELPVEKMTNACERILVTAERMEHLIAQVLKTAREEATSIVLDAAETDLGHVVKSAIDLNAESAAAKNIELATLADQASLIFADENRLVEALDNLVSNAIKYSEPESRVSIELGEDDEMVSIAVQDEGQGMHEHDLTLVFQRFTKLSAKPTAGESSTGLGLAIVKSIAEAHGGNVAAYSDGKNMGSRFVMMLPKTARDLSG